jgi:fatty acid desaturase
MLMLWTAIILFVLWILGFVGKVGDGVHMLLLMAIGFFIAWVMHRVEVTRIDEAEHRAIEREAVHEAENRPQLR